jgi:hypothetical protein
MRQDAIQSGMCYGLLVREGESGIQDQRLTRSIHKSNVVKSDAETVKSHWAISDALITAQERTPAIRRFLCGFDAHVVVLFLQ